MIPIIKACASSFSFENGIVIFEILIYKNERAVNKLKKTY